VCFGKANFKMFFSSYLSPANLLNPIPEIVDRLFKAYQTDLLRKIYFRDEVDRWKISWALGWVVYGITRSVSLTSDYARSTYFNFKL
jgi:hypothetical protein